MEEEVPIYGLIHSRQKGVVGWDRMYKAAAEALLEAPMRNSYNCLLVAVALGPCSVDYGRVLDYHN